MKKIVFAILLLTTTVAFGQNEAKHPIDIQRETCHNVDSNQTTAGMINCEIIAAELWDKQLNEYYNDLMKRLNKEEQDALKESQRNWIAYRDKELKFSGTFYYNLQGTMWRIVAEGRRCDFIRSRALELKEYLDALILE